jgi:hypothetical protein
MAKRSPFLTAAAIAVMALPAAIVGAAAPVTAPLHGGAVSTTKAHAFETLITPQGVRVFLYTDELAPAMVEKATGTAKLALPGGRTLEVPLKARQPAAGEPTSYFCPMHAEVVRDAPGKCELCGGMTLFVQDHLFGAVDLADVDVAAVSALIRVTGLRGGEKEATFAPAFSKPEVKAGPEQAGDR